MFDQIRVSLESQWASDKAAAHAAWASTSDKLKLDARTPEDIRRVVTGLVNLHHDTPKERCWFEFFITCPIFIERQFDKYRMTIQYQDFILEYLEAPMGRDNITQNELSGRYRTIPDRPYTLPNDVANICAIATDVAIRSMGGTPSNQLLQQEKDIWADLMNEQHEWYQTKLFGLKEAEKAGAITNADYKRAREVLRGVLGTSYLTDMRIVMNLNAFEHIINQRLAKDTQTESRIVAYHMIKEVLASGTVETLITEMIKANGWAPLMDEVEAKIKADL